MKVKVYFNLHKKLFSVVALEGKDKGRVIAHQHEVQLTDVQFKVSQAGRERVLREKRKNVHACVVGQLSENSTTPTTQITYNPYKYSQFVEKKTEQPIYTAKEVLLKDKQIWALV